MEWNHYCYRIRYEITFYFYIKDERAPMMGNLIFIDMIWFPVPIIEI